ncbi:HEAT repeat domain-containing protein [Algoriphagus sp. NF]|jgi:putative heme-binding domain-containing protein|uniref:HEAT repeat domain-containing protein n=1 Tax=Algoriphagus sp. NF TaxID=2992756 RepID=UPI00106558EE|nr:HEAT repeat domain-containing protein [Algoriphagus sp. NF]MDE0561417.1 HEAT repeat domain-containing protein [Algoriphagus sp. NF]
MYPTKFLKKLSIPLIGSFILFACQKNEPVDLRIKSLSKEEIQSQAAAAKTQVSPNLKEGLKLDVWAVDSLIFDPISIHITDDGSLYYTRTNRQKNSEFDIRGHQDWEIRSISLQNIEDKRKFLHEELSPERSEINSWLEDLNGDGSHDWRDMTVEKEQIFRVDDTDQDGYADQYQMIVEDFNDEVTDVAGAVMKGEDALYVGVGPDMWRMMDTNGDGIMDEKESISHGYGIHIGFGAHGMSGLEMGPDGRVYWGIGDIGFNGKGPDGKEWKYPNRGVIARANPDGSDFEIYAMGVRNTHEFVFDEHTNLISVDNDGDHAGEKERLVYITNGSDTGWRINWQFGKYRDPDNNRYKVWMDERFFTPRWEKQAAFITPPIANYVSGPTGMVYNPGAGLGPRWKDHFFVVEFVGNAANSGIHAFTLEPKGATFELKSTERIASGVLPTGMDFGPDGALYFADWIDGWGTKNYGRIWKLEDESAENWELQQQTKQELQADYKTIAEDELKSKLYHEDLRVRRKAQFELAKRGTDGAATFEKVLADKSNQLARIHAIVGLSQLARLDDRKYADKIVPYLQDEDAEIRAQAAKWLGDIRYDQVSSQLIQNLQDENARVRFFAAEALGRAGHKEAFDGLVNLLEANNDEDAYIRHAASLALARINEEEKITQLYIHPSKAVRMGAVIALRRLESPGLSKFLADSEELIVAEAARAIHDDFSVEASLPDLAALINTTKSDFEPLVRRIISANQRLGGEQQLNDLLAYVSRNDIPQAMKSEAIAALGTWSKPSLVDRVDGRYRGEVERDPTLLQEKARPVFLSLLTSNQADTRLEAVKAIGKAGVSDASSSLLSLVKSSSDSDMKVAALQALDRLQTDDLAEAIPIAMKDSNQAVRVAGLSLLSQSALPLDQKQELLLTIIRNQSNEEKRQALLTLSTLENSASFEGWETILTDFKADRISSPIWVELEEAIDKTGSETLISQFQQLLKEKAGDENWRLFQGALAEGNVREGRTIFFQNQAAQCIRCHAYDDMGGNAGPRLNGIARQLSREELLIALVEPSARLAPGYGFVTLELENGETVSGTLEKDSAEGVSIKNGQGETKSYSNAEIKEKKLAPSSMPSMAEMLNKREIRDLVSFLSTLNRVE